MQSKKRTIPQLILSELSGNCTLCIFDDITLSYIIKLWGVATFPSTFLTADGETIGQLQRRLGVEASLAVAAVDRRNAILDDFERGIFMGCSIQTELQGITTAIMSLKYGMSSLQSAIISSSCCNNGTAGLPDYKGEIPVYEGNPDNNEENVLLCRRLRYAQWIAQTWANRYIAPVAGLTISEIIVALGASYIAPPWGTEVVETAIAIVAGVAGIGAAGLINAISDALPALFDDLYCAIREDSFRSDSGVAGWVLEKLEIIVENPTIAKIISWIIGASGAMQAIFGAIGLSLDVPDGFDGEHCICDENSGEGALWYGVTECGTYPPDRQGSNWVEFDGKSYNQHTCGVEPENQWIYFYLSSGTDDFTGTVIYSPADSWSNHPTIYPIEFGDNRLILPYSGYYGTFRRLYARGWTGVAQTIRIEW